MKNYNFDKAKQLISEHPDTVSASLGMHEDWCWTAEEIWNKDSGYIKESGLIGGIDGSCWATPTLQLSFPDGSDKMIGCYTGDGIEVSPEEAASRNWANGCMSKPVQDNITPLSE
jgi:hypothetical protein